MNKKDFFKKLFNLIFYSFFILAEKQKKRFWRKNYSLLKIARKKVEKYTILGQNSAKSGEKNLFFWKLFNLFFFLFIYSFFILAEKQKKDFREIFIQSFFWRFFNLFLFAPKKKIFKKKDISETRCTDQWDPQ